MLSDEQIYECERIASIRHQRHKHSIRGQQITPADDLQWHFARAIEAEVRKQDDALIQQMLDALEYSSPNTNATYAWKDDCWALKRSEAINAARARLGEKT